MIEVMKDTLEERVFDTWDELLAETSQWAVDNLERARSLVMVGETISDFPEELGDDICKEIFTTNTPEDKEEIDSLWANHRDEFIQTYDKHFNDKDYFRLNRRFAIMCYIRERIVDMWGIEGVDRLRSIVKWIDSQIESRESGRDA